MFMHMVDVRWKLASAWSHGEPGVNAGPSCRPVDKFDLADSYAVPTLAVSSTVRDGAFIIASCTCV